MNKQEAIQGLARTLQDFWKAHDKKSIEYGHEGSGLDVQRTFLQIMYVYEGEKIGTTPQLEDWEVDKSRKTALEFVQDTKPYLDALGLKISYKHGGYITKRKGRVRSWNGLRYWIYSRRGTGAYHYFGYPLCCVTNYKENLDTNTLSLLYDLHKSDSENITKYVYSRVELEEMVPCTLYCEKSYERARKFKKTRKRYSKYMNTGKKYQEMRLEKVRENILKSLKFYLEYPKAKWRGLEKCNNKMKEKSKVRELFSFSDETISTLDTIFSRSLEQKKEFIEEKIKFIEEIKL